MRRELSTLGLAGRRGVDENDHVRLLGSKRCHVRSPRCGYCFRVNPHEGEWRVGRLAPDCRGKLPGRPGLVNKWGLLLSANCGRASGAFTGMSSTRGCGDMPPPRRFPSRRLLNESSCETSRGHSPAALSIVDRPRKGNQNPLLGWSPTRDLNILAMYGRRQPQ
jgi:hypothetical protein